MAHGIDAVEIALNSRSNVYRERAAADDQTEPRRAWIAVRSSPMIRLAVVTVVTVVAYRWSLSGFIEMLQYDTPLAYLAFVPVIATAVGIVMYRRMPHSLIHDRDLDWIVAGMCFATALGIAAAIRTSEKVRYWDLRLDLLGMPFFVAGTVSLLFGFRVLQHCWKAVALLLLMWPTPWMQLIPLALNHLHALTVRAVMILAPLLGVARSQGGGIFAVTSSGKEFLVNVAPECAGANSMLGYLLVAAPLAAMTAGRRRSKMLWLLSGCTLFLVLNTGRIVFIMYAGQKLGESTALGPIHSTSGLVMITIAAGASILGRRLFGLGGDENVVGAGTRGPHVLPGGSKAVITALIVVFVIALPFTLFGKDVRSLQAFQSPSGEPTRANFATAPPTILGVSPGSTSPTTWAKQFFGADATWDRFIYAAPSGARTSTIFLDAQSMQSWNRLRIHRPVACLDYHNYKRWDRRELTLVGSIPANYVNYRDGAGHEWSELSWEWPVLRDGKKVYERLIVTTPASPVSHDELIEFADGIIETPPTSQQ